MTDWREEHLTDPPDMADTYVLLDDGEVRVVGCEQCFQMPCCCKEMYDDYEAMNHWYARRRAAPPIPYGRTR